MADNYLEKKMEEHRARGSGRPAMRSKSTTAPWLPQGLTFTFPEMNVFVPGASDSEVGIELVKLLRSLGIRTACSGKPASAASRLAQETGARFYPTSPALTPQKIISDLTARWGRVDAAVILPDGEPIAADIRTVSLPYDNLCDAHAASLARLLAVLLHPSLSFL